MACLVKESDAVVHLEVIRASVHNKMTSKNN